MSTKSDATRPHKVVDNFLPAKWDFYTPHQPVRTDGSITNIYTGEVTHPPSRTKQEFKDQCNINKIIKEFTITGQITHISAKAAQGAFIDLPADLDYQNSLNIMIKAEDAFMALPAKVRDRFGNDPAAFLAFVGDPKNADELIELGIRERPLRAPPEAASGSGGDGGRPPVVTEMPAPAAPPGGSNPGSGGQAKKP